MSQTSAYTLGSLTIHAAPHWDPQIRAAGFSLDSLYVDRCWGAALGPTALALLRRTNDLWVDQGIAPTVDVKEFSRMVGLGKPASPNAPLWRTIGRLERFRFAAAEGPGQLTIYTEAPPLDRVALGRVPEWTRAQHDRLLDDHLAKLATSTAGSDRAGRVPKPTPMLSHSMRDRHEFDGRGSPGQGLER